MLLNAKTLWFIYRYAQNCLDYVLNNEQFIRRHIMHWSLHETVEPGALFTVNVY